MAYAQKLFQETPWDEMPKRPKHDSPEAKYFLMIQNQVPDSTLYQTHRPDELYRHLYTSMTRQIVDYFLDKHSKELRSGQSQLVAQTHDYCRGERKVQMGVYILTPQEMDELKAEWLREYQSRQKTHS